MAINPNYTQFSGCPNVATVNSCLRADTRAGHIKLGNQDTPINRTQTINGGISPSPLGGSFFDLSYNSAGGLTGDALEVPGGLAGLTGLSEFVLNLITFGANRVYADAVAVGNPRVNLSTFDIRLPIKINLLNPFLRSTCSIGSTSNPIVLNLTTGTTAPPAPARPISGHGPTDITADDPNLLLLKNIKLVDNTFAVPGASGCDLIGLGLINGLVNTRVGLPAAAGRNEAVFDQTDVQLIAREIVYP